MKSIKFIFLLFTFIAVSVMAMEPQNQIQRGQAIPYENIIRLIFMGKTGAGKSTSINTCYNFTKQKKWNDYPKLFPIPTEFQPCNVDQYQRREVERHDRGQLRAVTQDPSEYVAHGNNFVVNLIDCPGTADPDGVERDIENTNKIAQFLAKVGDFNAICIVLKGTSNRETAEERYFIEAIKTIIPQSAYNRIFIISTYTNLANENVTNFAESVGLPVENIFYFDNFGLTKEGHFNFANIDISGTGDDDLGDPFGGNNQDINQAEIEQKKFARKVRDTWPASHKEFNKLIVKAKSLGKHSSDPMGKICQIKRSATEKIFEAYHKVESIEQCQAGLERARHEYQMALDAYNFACQNKSSAECALMKAQAEKEAANKFKTYEYYDVKVRCDTHPTYHTICHQCNFTCHQNCDLGFKEGCAHLNGCACMTDGICHECPQKCSYTSHLHQYYYLKTESKRRDLQANVDLQASANSHYNSVSSILNDRINDMNAKSQTKDSKNTILDEFNRQLCCLKQEKDCLQQEIVKLYFELGRVSISSINFQIGEYYDLKMRNEKDHVKREKLRRDRIFYQEQVELYQRKMAVVTVLQNNLTFILRDHQDIRNYPRQCRAFPSIADDEYTNWARMIITNHKNRLILYAGNETDISNALISMDRDSNKLEEHTCIALQKIIEGQ